MKKLLLLAILFGASFTALTFAQEDTSTTDEGSSETIVTTTWTETINEKKTKRQEKRTQQLQKKEQIMQKKAVKVGARAERLRGVIWKINNGFLTSLLTQIDHLADKAKTEESKQMILDIKLLIQDKLGLLNVDEEWNVIDEIEISDDEDEIEDDEDENEEDEDDEDENETTTE